LDPAPEGGAELFRGDLRRLYEKGHPRFFHILGQDVVKRVSSLQAHPLQSFLQKYQTSSMALPDPRQLILKTNRANSR